MNAFHGIDKPAIPRWLLIVGLVGGAAIAAAGLAVGDLRTDLPPQAVARVNQRLILRDAWLRAVAAVASERRTPLTGEDQRRILDRLIDEELLVQHGIALGLVERDPRLRNALVSEVMLAATAKSADSGEAASQRFYAANVDFFTPTVRLRVAVWRLDADGQRKAFQPPVPDVLLPPAKLQSYLGPSLTAQAIRLQAREPVEIVDSAGGRVVLEVLEKQLGEALPFEQVKSEVQAEARRRADEAAVRELLSELRAGNRIVVEADLQ